MKCNNLRLRGSFTVEAAFVTPIITFAIIGIILVVFFLHNQVKADADIDMQFFALEREAASGRYRNNDSYYEFSNDLKGYFGGRVNEGVAERKESVMKVRLKLIQNIPDDGLLGLITKSISKIEKEDERDIPGREETTRLIKAAKEIIDGLKDLFKSGDK